MTLHYESMVFLCPVLRGVRDRSGRRGHRCRAAVVRGGPEDRPGDLVDEATERKPPQPYGCRHLGTRLGTDSPAPAHKNEPGRRKKKSPINPGFEWALCALISFIILKESRFEPNPY